MKNQSVRNYRKIAAGLLAAALIATGVYAMPTKAGTTKATDATEITYVACDENFKMSDYWSATEKKAPVKDGYVFGGWYKGASDPDGAEDGKKALTETEAATFNGTVYAKFVPAYVLSVKAQNGYGTTGDTAKTNTRVISSVDATDYQTVGMQVQLGNSGVQEVSATKVYSGIIVKKDANTEETFKADAVFGEASKYLMVWKITNIAKANFAKSICVRPYWVTPDGTKVYGLAKYVHVEDGYSNYISVPVNLMTGQKIAAGMLQVTCTDDRVELPETGAVENGKLFAEMEYNRVNDKTVKIVANGTTVGTNEVADGIYANIRFKLKDGKEWTSSNPLIFTISGESFCNWAEQTVTIDAWDYRY